MSIPRRKRTLGVCVDVVRTTLNPGILTGLIEYGSPMKITGKIILVVAPELVTAADQRIIRKSCCRPHKGKVC